MGNSDKPALIIVDDDPLITDTLHFVLGRDFEVAVAASRPQAQSLLQQLTQPPGLALVDLGLPPTPHRPDEGFRLIGELLAYSPSIKILVLSGQSDEAHARHARSLGAVDFIAKPCDPQKLRDALFKALEFRAAELREQPTEEDGIVGASFPMEKLRSQIQRYADSPFPVLVEGESGSGKELVAAALRKRGRYADKPFLALNCAAISPNLVEPTLFGYSKGAFTGAHSARSGYFEDAQDGILFLDEIGELPLELQAKLLRVLENGEYQRVGETQTRVSRARVVAATNRDLRQEVQAGRFRGDLYHRLSVLSVTVPPLRELEDDKFALLEHYRDFYAGQGGVAPFHLDERAARLWGDYAFPGNVRELRNIVIRLTTKYPGMSINTIQLQAELDGEWAGAADGSAWPKDPKSTLEAARRHLRTRKQFDLDDFLRQWEAAYVEAALDITGGNLSQAARLLGIQRTTLYSRMRHYGKAVDNGGD